VGKLGRILFYLAIDCRITHTRLRCHVCRSDAVVPLARVYLRAGGESPDCRVLLIDAFPPHRRLLGRDLAPALPGTINIGHLIGGTAADALLGLAALGIRVQSSRRVDPVDDLHAADLVRALDCGCGPMVRPNSAVTVVVGSFGDEEGSGDRVLGFCYDSVKDPPDDHDPPREPEDPDEERRRENEARPRENEGMARHREEARGQARLGGEDRAALISELTSIGGIGRVTATRLADRGIDLADIAEMSLDELIQELPEAVRPNAAQILEQVQARAGTR
jgi:predicted flap endonuclease-1-like 5' DNA nuclease